MTHYVVMLQNYYAISRVLNFVLESPAIGLHASKVQTKKHFLIVYGALYLLYYIYIYTHVYMYITFYLHYFYEILR